MRTTNSDTAILVGKPRSAKTVRQQAARRRARRFGRLLIAAQERERAAIGRELHDDVTQQIAAAAIDLSIIVRRLPSGHERDGVVQLVDRLRKLSTHVHGLSRRMHPHALETLGLARAIEGECRAFAQRTGIGMKTALCPDGFKAKPDIAITVFRVCQEALHNVEKHARATGVRVGLDHSADEIRLCVADTGLGFDLTRPRRGIGLASMRERAVSVGGRISIVSTRGRGSTIRLTIPLDQRARP
jgi:signal transduction histidine kinase